MGASCFGSCLATQPSVLAPSTELLSTQRDEDMMEESNLTSAEQKALQEEEDAREAKKRQQATSGGKRRSVSAASISEEEIKSYKCPSYPKPDSAKTVINKCLKTNEKMNILGVSRFNKAELDEMVMAFQEKTVTQNQDVIKQGDQGDCLYIVDEGSFDIFVARPGDDGKLGAPFKVANFGAGALFGELALMYSAPRAATVKCSTPTAKVWSLDREPFQMMLKRCGVQMVEQYSGWLTQVDILKVLNLHEISQLADACEGVLLDEGEVIMQQGEEGDAFYILEEGSCAAFIETADGEKLVKSYTKQGEYFGELALINKAPRKATVRATTEASVLRIGKDTFDDMLGPIGERLQARASEYPQYAEALKK